MIEIKDLTFGYDKKASQVFEQTNLTFEKNKVYGLLGKNGTGKTTLLHLISGLLFADSGSITIDGTDAALRSRKVLSEMLLLPDECASLRMTVARYAELYGAFYPRFSPEKFEECLSEFDIEPSLRLDGMSLGQRKKAYISFALATQVGYLLMDEPTNGLDIPSKSTLRRLLLRQTGDSQTVIISTHQAHDIEQMLDHVVIVGSGRCLFSRSVADITADYAFVERSTADGSDVVYAEPSPQGYRLVTRNNDKQDTTLDLELLFKAVVTEGLKA